ncbi:ABC transporter ATP-binding protein, partial [Aquiflexum sp.]|uniref:ABC transporter ATP-binding protein n=1 Tax=Aquiflexum sp. TaxID=1872584 RepID=UPI0035940CE2
MSDTIIKVENLSKRYRIGLQEKKADTFAQQMVNVLKYPIDNFKKIQNLGKFQDKEEGVHWALKEVSFEVKQGEVLGIIGKNGAGKSTLLKILSKITEPTSGRIEMNGRVAALLEVGTGFHQELSGRENIYMNGTILGMTKREIDLKLDEIIDFSGVEKYIDTPVKFYSSGMRVRLGFSVAAHLEPEILIIDEVLAVGDFEFQQKCLGKMENVSKQDGRTVLFVSHNMEVIRNLCPNSLLLANGRIIENGDSTSVVDNYIHEGFNSDLDIFNIDLLDHPEKDKKLNRLGLSSAKIFINNKPSNRISTGDSLKIVFKYQMPQIDFALPIEIGLGILNSKGERLIAFNNKNFKKEVTL